MKRLLLSFVLVLVLAFPVLSQTTSNIKNLGAVNITTAKITTGAGLGKILTSDADGDLSYITAGTTGQVLLGATGADPVFGSLGVAYVTGAAATADLATDNSTASHALYKDSSGDIANQVLSIDAHAGSTTITLIPGICPIIHNTGMGDANVTNALPAVADGLCFTALVVTAEDDKTWRLSAAAVNTICLGETCGKDDIGFATGEVDKGAMFKCVAQGTEWFCTNITGTADAGDL